jgi:hypothetical protein
VPLIVILPDGLRDNGFSADSTLILRNTLWIAFKFDKYEARKYSRLVTSELNPQI